MTSSLQSLVRKSLPKSVGPCLFRPLDGGYLLTNEWGRHLWLEEEEFHQFMGGTLPEETPIWEDLRLLGFIGQYIVFPELIEDYKRRAKFLQAGPGLHVVQLTRRNNQTTPYELDPKVVNTERGQDTPVLEGTDRADLVVGDNDLTMMAARRLVKSIFDTSSSEITIELRGGEPLLNWEVLEFLVRHARSFASFVKRNLTVAVVSNLSALDDRKLDFLVRNEVRLCTYLDGPADLHDKHRSLLDGRSSHAETVRWLKIYAERYPEAPPIETWLTVTRDSLGRASDIVNEYVRLGIKGIYPRLIFPAAAAKKRWRKVGYTAEEYLKFYKQLLDAIIGRNKKGAALIERNAALLLFKILRNEDPGHTELRMLFGGGISQLAYDFKGDVYLNDEGRAVSTLEEDDIFRLGSIYTPLKSLVGHPMVRAAAVSSDLGAQPLCSQCAYQPYCGVSPVYNYAAQGSLGGRNPTNDRCASYMGIFDLLFMGLRDAQKKKVFEEWAASVPSGADNPPPPFHGGGML